MRTREHEMVKWIIQHETQCSPETAGHTAKRLIEYIRSLPNMGGFAKATGDE